MMPAKIESKNQAEEKYTLPKKQTFPMRHHDGRVR